MSSRQAGVLLPLFSLRSATDWGVGEIPDLVPFARWARDAGLSLVLLLPVNEAARGQTSPYFSLSAFAIDPVYVALEALPDFQRAGGADALTPGDRELLAALRRAHRVRWSEVRALKRRGLLLAFDRFLKEEWERRTERAQALARFAEEERSWLRDYALYVALHDQELGGVPWSEWPEPLRERDPDALSAARERHARELLFQQWQQWVAEEQWRAARRAANAGGVALGGDLPFMVASDSADVWARREDFRTDARVGVPPDAFSPTGQDWGFPVYRWPEMQAAGYPWIRERARRMADLYDLYRVDHVVGLYRTYFLTGEGPPGAFVPAEEPEQLKNGEAVLRICSEGARVVAEDLGVVPDFVRESLTALAIPGYRVQRWEKNWKEGGDAFLDPAEWPALSLATTGTHDTDAVADWYEGLKEEERTQLLELPGLAELRERVPTGFDEQVRDALLETVYGAGSDLAIFPFQDLLGSRERVNTPGTVSDDNWSYRIPMDLSALAADRAARERLRGLAARSGRAPGGPP
ncbi:MAG TPA: 4-alpha-glucanotransferase [Anaeromyxobacter sp.]|nr:4-alpha-glucanotransferase [Anaeromyxobacter sp.]